MAVSAVDGVNGVIACGRIRWGTGSLRNAEHTGRESSKRHCAKDHRSYAHGDRPRRVVRWACCGPAVSCKVVTVDGHVVGDRGAGCCSGTRE